MRKKVIILLISLIMFNGCIDIEKASKIAGFNILKNDEDIYKYIPVNSNSLLLINSNSDTIRLLEDANKANVDIKNLKYDKEIKNIQKIRAIGNLVSKVIIFGEQKDYKENVICVQTKAPNYILKKALENEKKITKISDGVYSFTDGGVTFYGIADDGNLIIGNNLEKIKAIVKNKSGKAPIIKRLKPYQNRDIVLISNNLPFIKSVDKYAEGIVFIDIIGEMVNMSVIANTNEKDNASLKQLISFNENDGLSGRKTVQKNKFYIRTKSDKAAVLGLILPNLVINSKGEKNGELVTDIARNQFLYTYFLLNNDVYYELKGYIDNSNVKLEANMNRKVFINLLDKKKRDDARKSFNNMLQQSPINQILNIIK